MKTIQTERIQNTLLITINRPDKLNALSPQVVTDLSLALANTPKGVRGIVVTGAGTRAFVAGADIAEMNRMTPEEGEAFAFSAQALTEQIETHPLPVIAAVNGFALGGGCELALSCDFIFATENAVFGQPEVNLGLIPGFGGCVRLQRRIGAPLAKELIYTARSLSAAEALQAGLVNRVLKDKNAALSAAFQVVEDISARSANAVRLCKEAITDTETLKIREALNLERNLFRAAFEHPDKNEGVAAFVQKRPATFTTV